jgi:hypothetical protein
MYTILLFALQFSLGSCVSQYIKHKDYINIYNLVVNTNGTAKRDDSTFTDYTRFRIEKYPYYKSDKDYVIGGRTILLVNNATGHYCAFNDQKLFVCLPTKPQRSSVRIIGKHDKDGEPLYSSQQVKFRYPNSSIDCSAKINVPFACTRKSDVQYYTFVIAKDI